MSLSTESNMVMPVTPAYGMGCGMGYGMGYGMGGMFGGDWFAWIILLLLFGNRGWGNGNDGCCAPATCADLQRGFDNQGVTNKLNGLENGLCSLGYDQLREMNGINTNILNGFAGVDNAVCQLGYQNQTAINGIGTQLQQCCCDTREAIQGVNYNTLQNFSNLNSKIDSCCCETQRQIERGFCDTNYNLATNTTAIIQNAHNDTDRVIAKLNDMEATRQQERIAALQAENQSLKFQASQSAQNAFITANQDAQTAELIRRLGRDVPVPSYLVPNPNCCYGNFGLTGFSGCGCNSCGC